MSLNKIDTLGNENHIDSLSNKHLDKDNFIDYENLATEYSNIQEHKSTQKKTQSEQADLLIDKLMENQRTKDKFIADFNLNKYNIQENDFDIIEHNGSPIICGNTSYFCSIVGLNGLREKEQKDILDRKVYDKLDEVFKECIQDNIYDKGKVINLINTYKIPLGLVSNKDLFSNGGCVISENENKLVGIKKSPLIEFMEKAKGIDINNSLYMKDTISHETQHLTFSKILRKKQCPMNPNLAILDEVLAHCKNTKNNSGAIDFDKIISSITSNGNYLSVYLGSGGERVSFEKDVEEITKYVQNILGDKKEYNEDMMSEMIDHFAISKLGVINNYNLEKGYELIRNILAENLGCESLSLCGRSGTTGVYINNTNQDIVYKLSTKDVLKQIYSIIDKNFIYTDNGVYKQSVQRINTEVAEVFPKGTVLCPTLYVKEMDISPEVIKQFCKDAGIDMDFNNLKDNYTIPVTYTTQSFATELADKSGVSFNFDHTKDSLEKLMGKDIITKAYSKIGPNSEEVAGLPPKDVLMFLDRKFDLLLEQIYSISPDKSKVKEFFSSIINYSKQHNTGLDIFGFNNFTFFKNKNGTLDFHVIDPIFDGKATCDFSLHKTWGKGNIKNGEDFNKFSYPYIIEKMEKYIQS